MRDVSEFAATLPPYGRLMGLDVGEKTIGLALSDTTRMIATPHLTIARKKFSADAAELQQLAKREALCGLVIGYPINMNGTEGPRCQSIRQFAQNLHASVKLPMLLWDERMSTMAVERVMLEADLSRARRDELVDKMAAAYLLQGCLDMLAGQKKHP